MTTEISGVVGETSSIESESWLVAAYTNLPLDVLSRILAGVEPPNYWKTKIGAKLGPPFLERVSQATFSDLHSGLETPISFTLMVHHIDLYKLKPEVTPARVEEMMMNARMQLLKIPEVLSIKCGKRIEPEMDWPFFVAIDFESMDKYAIFREDPIFVKFIEEVIKPNTEDSLALDFEMDPGKDVRFS